MINADEHKKLLEQIKELEKNSINYFDVEKEFFLIDSNNLSQIRPKLYGYSIQRNGIYEDDNLTEDAAKNLDGRGCYVYVDVKDGQITIKQDLNGCWGIYLFRQGDYFALSNSFFRLLDHIKFKYPLTVNRDYCHQLIVGDLVSHAYSETAVNEVRLIERNAILHIDVAAKNLAFEFIDYREYTISLDSQEGVDILDRWVEFWGNILSGIQQHTRFIQADLSGGFDSRSSLLIALNSDIDLNKIRINSIIGKVHTYKEDYEIASQIAENYGFKLNQTFSERRLLNYSLYDVFNAYIYNCATFRKFFNIVSKKGVDKLYVLTGFSGETMRSYWYKPPKEWLEERIRKLKMHSLHSFDKLANSVKVIFEAGFRNVCDKYGIKDEDSPYIMQLFYQEVRSRSHQGKAMATRYLANEITLAPALDPEVRTLKLETPECSDPNLLSAFIFVRYASDLLTFPFNNEHSLAPETIEYAKKINKKFPLVKKAKNIHERKYFHLQPRDLQAEKILATGKNNPRLSEQLLRNFLKVAFDSSRTYGLFNTYFDEEIYHYAISRYEGGAYGFAQYLWPVLGINRVIEDVEISNRRHSPYQDIKRLLEQDFCLINSDEAKIINKFKEFFTARILIRLDKEMNEENLQIVSFSDSRVKLFKPRWWQKRGICYAVDSYVGQLEIVAKAVVEGTAQIRISGAFNKQIDYTKFTVNEQIIFDTITPACHKKPYVYDMDVKAGEEIKINVEWLPHKSND